MKEAIARSLTAARTLSSLLSLSAPNKFNKVTLITMKLPSQEKDILGIHSPIVGMLLEHEGEYKVVGSSETGFMQYDSFSWEVKGNRCKLSKAI